MASFFLPYQSSLIHYRLSGKGEKLLLGFHGYGGSGEAFDFFEKAIPPAFTVLVIDLPFHGKTTWNEGLHFSVHDLLQIIGQVMREVPPCSSIYLMGFSMGARVALGVLNSIPEKIGKVILLAPDGLKTNGWYWLATQNRFGRKLFRLSMQQPAWFFVLLRLGNTIKLVSPAIYTFAMSNLRDPAQRTDLYRRWSTMRSFRNEPGKIRALINQNKIPCKLVYGEEDRVMRPSQGKRFSRGIENYCELIVLPCGHQVLQKKNLDALMRLLED